MVRWLRWACVLPAAVLGSLVAQFIAERVGLLAVSIWGRPADSAVTYYFLLLWRIPIEAGFVVAGAKTAPRGHVRTAISLAIVRVLFSLIVHIVRQSSPGVVNYTHFAFEFMGSSLGVAYILYTERIRKA